MHGPSATQPAQQNASPTWNVGPATIGASQVTQWNMGSDSVDMPTPYGAPGA